MSAALNSKRSKKPAASVRQLPNREQPPQWLRSLLLTQQVSVFATFVLAGAVLAVYGWTVYAQQLWGKEYSRLEQLRRNERQITTSGEVLKNQIANQSNRPGSTLVPQNPDNLIFLRTAPARPEKPVSASSQSSPVAPLGY
ncbi:hypothetical protein [Leptolyngbya sp. NIES-2104]|uniref:hypothetical protein n=1 Tax=Leptolyngbya sp. NIES-2104 TaxID=1552121 RepID=UPI0006EC614C|nr:hypothetical protein [Leptolyngbya sp. NIES-2104]GAP97288.1 cell division protein FtsL [Leptolyngbya sp. NIES-2104]